MKFEVFLPQIFRYSRCFYLKYTGYAYEKVFYQSREEVVIRMGRVGEWAELALSESVKASAGL